MTWVTFLAAAAAAMQPQPAAPAPDAAAQLAKNVVPIEEVAPGRYRGAGWDRLIGDAADAHFFMIGEQHATADIAHFAVAAHDALATRGYTHAAYEIGPYSMDFAESLIRSGKGRLGAYVREPGNAFVLPFLFFREEVDLAEQIVAASPDRENALWGLDQEFVGSAPVSVQLLRRWSTTEAQRTAVETFAAKASANPQLIGALPWSELAFLEAPFTGNDRARKLIAALKLSNQIYAPFTGRGGSGYGGNLARENYMKANFARRFAAAEQRSGKPPKVFMKFGGNHAQKGFTGTNVPGLANFLYEWGVPRGLGLLNIMVDCIGGEALNPQTNKPEPCQPYYGNDSAIAKLPKANRLTLIDLRPLRPLLRRMSGLDEESRRLILSFDYYLAIKDVKAATPTAAAR